VGDGVSFMGDIEVVFADDQPLSLIGLRSAVADEGDIHVLAECQDPECLAETVRQKPHVLVVNSSLLGDELGALKQLVTQNHRTQVIVITSHTDREFLDGAARCGARGVIQAECSLDEIPKAIRKVRSGGVWREKVAA
jgi:DNA-binding NarL/FixJ family response regulator